MAPRTLRPKFRNNFRDLAAGLAAIVVTAMLLTLCLPLGEQAYLAPFALVPLALATRGRGFLFGFLAGLATVLLAAWISTTGLLYAHHSPGETAWVFTGFGIFGASFAIAFAVWGEPGTKEQPAYWFGAVAVLAESILLLKLPAHLALSQYRHAGMVQLASVGGVWLATFLLWWSNFALAGLFRAGKLRVAGGMSIGILLVWFATAHVWLPWSGTKQRLAAVQTPGDEEKPLVDGEMEASRRGASLVVWPEFGGLAMAPSGDTTALRKLSQRAGAAPFVTSYRDAAQPLPHNVASLFARGKEDGQYFKRKLFGGETNMHAPGDHAVAVGDLGLNVCYDSCFPTVVRETAQLGAHLVALPTIDPPSRNDFIAAIHASYTPFRAAENGVAFVRADGYSFSEIVDAQGRIVAELRSGEGVLVADASVGPRWTVSKFVGEAVLYLCGVVVLAVPLRRVIGVRR